MCAYPMSAAMVDRYSSCVRRRISKTCTIDAGPVGKTALDEGTGLEEAAEEEKDDEELLLLTDVACLCLASCSVRAHGLTGSPFCTDIERCCIWIASEAPGNGGCGARGTRTARISPVLRARAACFIGVGLASRDREW